MSQDRKKSTKDALDKFLMRDMKEQQRLMGRGKKNGSPEKDVELACKLWLELNGFTNIEIYDSKAVFSNGHWHNRSVATGHSDCGATCPEKDAPGVQAWLEFKAKGKLATFLKDGNERQRDFIISRIHAHCFAVVIDSSELLEAIYKEWLKCRSIDPACAKQYLLSCLPTRKSSSSKAKTPKDNDEMGF